MRVHSRRTPPVREGKFCPAPVAVFALLWATTLPVAAATVELDAKKQKYIWDMEHITFQLETHLGRPFLDAWKRRAADELRQFLRTDFRGVVLAPGRGTVLRAGTVSEERFDVGSTPMREVGARGFVADLLSRVAEFRTFTGAGFRVLQIDLEDEASGIYRTEILLTVRGTTDAGGPVEFEAAYLVRFRFTEDSQIRQGRVMASAEVLAQTRRGSPRPIMQEVTKEVGLTRVPLADNWLLPSDQARNHRYQIAVEDFDRDGYPDIAVGAIEGEPYLLRSVRGRRFDNVARELGLKPGPPGKQLARNSLVGWIDFNNDGYPDLIMGERFYRNLQGRRFIDITANAGLKFDRVPMGIVVADYDLDGDLDLYVVYQKKFGVAPPPGKRPWVGDSQSGADNELWLNEAGSFENVTASAGAGGGRRQTFAAAAFFFDEDRYPDLYLANDLGINVLLRNRGDGTFEDLTEPTGSGDFATSMGVATGDVNNDGSPEIYVGNMYSKMGRRIIAHVGDSDYPAGIYEQIRGSCAGNRLYTRAADQTRYRETSVDAGVNEVGWAYAPAMVDLDGDGLLDLYATTGFMSFNRHEPDG